MMLVISSDRFPSELSFRCLAEEMGFSKGHLAGELETNNGELAVFLESRNRLLKGLGLSGRLLVELCSLPIFGLYVLMLCVLELLRLRLELLRLDWFKLLLASE